MVGFSRPRRTGIRGAEHFSSPTKSGPSAILTGRSCQSALPRRARDSQSLSALSRRRQREVIECALRVGAKGAGRTRSNVNAHNHRVGASWARAGELVLAARDIRSLAAVEAFRRSQIEPIGFDPFAAGL